MWKLDETVKMETIFTLFYSAPIGFFNEISSLSALISNHIHLFVRISSTPVSGLSGTWYLQVMNQKTAPIAFLLTNKTAAT